MTQKELENIWPKAVEKLLNSKEYEEDSNITERRKDLLNEIKGKMIKKPQEYIKLFMGLIKKEHIAKLKRLTNMSENQYKDFLLEFCNELRKQFYFNIWNIRCKEIINMERVLGIIPKIKRFSVDQLSYCHIFAKKVIFFAKIPVLLLILRQNLR